jgi:hypothetical protein
MSSAQPFCYRSQLHDHQPFALRHRPQAQVIGQCSKAIYPMPRLTGSKAKGIDFMSKAIGWGQFVYNRVNVPEFLTFAYIF